MSTKSGVVYEKDLITKYLSENAGKDPITGDQLTEDDLVEIKTGELARALVVGLRRGARGAP